MILIQQLRSFLRGRLIWIRFQELSREGWRQSFRRWKIQKAILNTPPLRTLKEGATEVRVLTWRRDWMNSIWALKSFYCFSEVRYPLFIHDGGLTSRQLEVLRTHFPDAFIVPRAEADLEVQAQLKAWGCDRCIQYRNQNVATLKLFDFFILSKADSIISIDSDIVFFKKPLELLDSLAGSSRDSVKNKYNQDQQYAYSMPLEEIEKAFGILPIPLVNSGLSRVNRSSMDFKKMDQWLTHPRIFEDKWVTEQTLHALCSALFGVELLPLSYLVSTSASPLDSLICKHYPGFFRPLLYSEGMKYLLRETNFFSRLNSGVR
jgi:hypothetical protein